MTQFATAGMEHWATSKYGIDPDDGKSDDEKYPPPAAAAPGVFTPSPGDVPTDPPAAESEPAG